MRKMIKIWLPILLCCALLTGCMQSPDPTQVSGPTLSPESQDPKETMPEETPVPSAQVNVDIDSDLLMDIEGFSFKLLTNLMAGRTSENSVFSPVGVGASLSSLGLASGGDTSKQIKEISGFALEFDAALASYKNLYEALEIKPSSSFLLNRMVAATEGFTAAINGVVEYASVAFGEAEGTTAVNAACAKVAPEFASLYAETAAADSLYLLSGIAPSLRFKEAFPGIETFEGLFDSPNGLVPCDAMYTEADLLYFEDENMQICAIDMDDGRTQLRLLLPSDNSRPDIQELLNQYGSSWLLRDDLQAYPVRLTLPKVAINGTLALKENLISMGLTLPFAKGQADFSPLMQQQGYPLAADRFTTMVKFNFGETGINQSDELDLSEASFPENEAAADLNLMEPFLFALVDTGTGATLVMGWINTP